MANLTDLPADLPVPQDDGACDHLSGLKMPDLPLVSTQGGAINLARLNGLAAIYVYPKTGRPDVPLPEGWDAIPGARGCTPQSCSFRDQYQQIQDLDCNVFGLSTQAKEYQTEAVERLGLPFALLSDESLHLARALSLPTFDVDGMTLLRRVTMICENGIITKVFYPVFPPDQNVNQVLEWLNNR